MLKDASITFSFDPSTSFHYTGTSPILILNILHSTKSSISNAHLSMWSTSNNCFADYFVNSLNPHWVSSVLIPHTTFFTKPKTADTIFLWNFLSTLAYYSKCLRDPTIIISGCDDYFSMLSIFLIILLS